MSSKTVTISQGKRQEMEMGMGMGMGCPGDHSGFEFPEEDGARFGVPGAAVDTATIGALVGAAFDGCVPCQDRLLGVIQADPLATVRLVEVAAIMTNASVGGLPPAMVAEGPSGRFTEPFRYLMRLGVDSDDHAPMYSAAVAMAAWQRRQAVNDGLDMIVGQMAMGS